MGSAKPIQEVSVWKAREQKRKEARDKDKDIISQLWFRIGALEEELSWWRSWSFRNCGCRGHTGRLATRRSMR